MQIVIIFWIFINFFLILADVAAEKNQQNLFAGIAGFDPSNLKHTETQEKNPLPDKEGSLNISL